jgi:hypothetical protein
MHQLALLDGQLQEDGTNLRNECVGLVDVRQAGVAPAVRW